MAVNRASHPKLIRVTIVGAGSFAGALARALHRAGCEIESIVAKNNRDSLQRARALANNVGSRATSLRDFLPSAGIVWLCVPDESIHAVAELLVKNSATNWKKQIVFHSSGALTSDELNPLRLRGAAVASVHPLMTFVRGSESSLAGVPFAMEGDAGALRQARAVVGLLGGQSFSIRKKDKAAYHAWATFCSPLLTALLATSEHVAGAAGLAPKDARQRMLPILAQTLANYAALGPARGFSGPLVRGDVEVVRRHMLALRQLPEAHDVYASLALAALKYLPGKNRDAVRKALKQSCSLTPKKL